MKINIGRNSAPGGQRSATGSYRGNEGRMTAPSGQRNASNSQRTNDDDRMTAADTEFDYNPFSKPSDDLIFTFRDDLKFSKMK